MIWHIPNWHGDLAIRPEGPKSCKVEWSALTLTERAALETLFAKAKRGLRTWLSDNVALPAEGSTGFTLFAAPIEKVSTALAKALKPEREIVSVVKFANGKIEKVTEQTFTAVSAKEAKKPEVAASVAKPTRGCPLPAFELAEVKARRVLTSFLTEEQSGDFVGRQAFVSVGADTGHRYALTSRHSPMHGEHGGRRRTLHDLDERMDYCVHDWDVPAAEELLALHVFLQIPGGESYLRRGE